ncbi:PAS domain S-box protein [Sporomusa sphaeroides]|uniref:PAS domain S-box protein n=1 Tax=Sporomusa sphaeroides TaxID=47679 RepID=UPI002BA4E331|nr:PAS domain S-box protein [Sporomusa sphaeroides]HML35758.1 PAS domain S-box protein [Sporomusa sphaeroides]
MRKSWLMPVFICSTLVAGLILLAFYGEVDPANHRFLTNDWEYSWGDRDPQHPEAGEWLPKQGSGRPEGYNGQNYLWLRVPLPPGSVKTPTVFTEFVHQSLQVYVDGTAVYQQGLMPVPPGEKLRLWLPYHIIPLPDDAPGKMLYFRISSSSPSIGIFGGVEYGPMWGMYKYKNMIEFLKFCVFSLLTAAGLWSLIVYLYDRKKTVYLAFAANALCGAGILFCTTYSSFLFYPNPDFWNNWIIVTSLSWKIVWLQFLMYIVTDVWRRTVRRLVWLTVAFSCLQMAAAVMNPLWIQSVMVANMVYSIGCYLAVLYFCRSQLRFNREAQLYAGGISVWMAASTVDAFNIVGVIHAHLLIGWLGQLAETSSLAAILALRYVSTRSRLQRYAQELEELAATLETKVTERTEKLSIQKACLEQLFANSPDAIVTLDPEYRVTKVNPAFTALFGYTAREAEGRNIGRLLCVPGDTPAEEHILDCPDRASGVPLDIVRRHKDGNSVAIALTAFPFVTESGETGVCAVYRDISRWALTKRNLMDSERKYRLLAENLDAVVWLIDFDQRPIYISPSLERLTGYTLTEYLRQPLLKEKNRRLQAAVDEVWDAYRQGKKRDTPVVLEEEKRTRDGCLIWIESTVNIAYDENGEALGILGVSRDITARKRTEKLLSLAYERKRLNHFFNDLLDGVLPFEQDIYNRARQLRVNLPQSFTVCFCQVEDSRHSAGSEGQDMLLDEVADRLNRQDGLAAWNFSGGIGVICRLPLPYGGRQSEQAEAALCLKLLLEEFPGVRFSIGVADYSTSLADFNNRFRHAVTAARIGRRRREDSCIQYYEECGIDEIFDNFAGTREAEAFVCRVLGPLYDYDRDNGTELVETLSHILSRGTLREIADMMHIHPKTIAARKQRIEQILNISLDSFEERMTLGAALQIDKCRLDSGGVLTPAES